MAAHPQAEAAARQVLAGQPRRAARRALAVVAIACAVIFLADSALVATHKLLFFDEPVERAVQAIPWGPLGAVMTFTNSVAGAKQVIAGLLAIAALWFIDRRSGMLMALGSIGSFLDEVVKDVFARHRPDPSLVHVLNPVTGYSYPSGHAVFFTWLAFMLAAGLAPRVGRAWRVPLWAAAVFLALIACMGRVWVGAHWPSDVLGGFVMSLGWSAFVLWIPERWLPRPVSADRSAASGSRKGRRARA
jgi:membrane-associated phospholipid phosphatase